MGLRNSRLRRLLGVAGIAVLPWTLGCSSGKLETLQLQLDDLERQVSALSEAAATRAEIAALETQLEQSEDSRNRQHADAVTDRENIAERIQILEEQVADGQRELVELSRDLEQSDREIRSLLASIPAHGEGGPPSIDTSDPEALYQSAYSNYQLGNFELAILGFDEFLEVFPDSELADNALYWKGESFFSQRRYEEAVYAFARVLAVHPSSEKVPSATLKRAFAHIERGETEAGREQLRRLLAEHPSSAEAELARRELRELDRSN